VLHSYDIIKTDVIFLKLKGQIKLDHLENLNLKLQTLVIFRGLLDDKVLCKLHALLSHSGKSIADKLDCFSDFVSALFRENISLTDYIWNKIALDQNIYVLKCAGNETLDPILEQCLANELKTLEEISLLSAQEVKESIGYEGYLPEWKTRRADFVSDYKYMINHISTLGYGEFLKYRMFSLINTRIVPVYFPDQIRLSDLKGYERERNIVVNNTKALLSGKPASNVLLYGDAGTGKSSTVKAIVNEYADSGLRLVEVRKNQILEIPAVIESLYNSPLKFILFVDDLSFAGNNEEIGVLKAILEGTVSARAANIVIYATSNRRHLINEKFSDRENDEIHRNETIQEQVSLSDRFGLSVNFSRPDRAQYLAIVFALVQQYDIRNIDELELRAERYAIERGGRSPRVARQFAEQLKSNED
jgi:uncharacterized protein